MDSYRCFRTWIWDTQRERKADTLAWFPKTIQMPIATSLDLAIAGINDIAAALANPIDVNAIALNNTEVQSYFRLWQ